MRPAERRAPGAAGRAARRGLAVAAAVAALAALPAVLTSYAVSVLILVFFYGYLGQAWNILGGHAGQLSAGHAAFVGVGAYATTLLAMHAGVSPWAGMLAGGALAAALGAVIGALGFRFGLRGFYFVLLTVAFAEVCRILALNLELTGGALGLYITFTGDPWQLQFQDPRGYYWVALAMVIAATGVVAVLERSRLGAELGAVREDEDAAEALGVDTFRCKLAAIVLSAFLTGLGGAFYASYVFSLQPNAVFGIPLSVDIVIRPVVGGAGTLVGPLLGAVILSPLAEVSRIYLAPTGWAGLHLIVYGLLLVLIVLFLPQGAYPHLRRAWTRRRAARGETVGTGSTGPGPSRPGTRPPAGGTATAAGHPPAEARGAAPLLEVVDVQKRFGGVRAVGGVSLAVRAGEIVGLIGPNGAGKTTLFHLIAGAVAPDGGDVRLDGRSIRGLRPHEVCRRGLARTFQLVRPFAGLSVLENVRVAALVRAASSGAATAQAREVLALVGLEALADRPAGALTLADRKRLELARALATAPRLLLLDEVMAGLTAPETERVIALCRTIHGRGVAILLTEHVMRAVMALSQRVVVVSQGEVIASGSPAAIARDPRVLEAYLGEPGADPDGRPAC